MEKKETLAHRIAKIYDISQPTVNDIKSGKNWSWLTNGI